MTGLSVLIVTSAVLPLIHFHTLKSLLHESRRSHGQFFFYSDARALYLYVLGSVNGGDESAVLHSLSCLGPSRCSFSTSGIKPVTLWCQDVR